MFILNSGCQFRLIRDQDFACSFFKLVTESVTHYFFKWKNESLAIKMESKSLTFELVTQSEIQYFTYLS